MECDKCGSKMECDESKILTSYPPKQEYKCKNCGNVKYKILGGNITHPQETKGYLQGWVCPKCGSVMSPYQSVCPHCQPPQKLEIWC